jgi:hypothetical protein
MIRDSGPCQRASFGLAENKLGLSAECGNAAGVIGMEMGEKHRLRLNVQARELRRQICTRLLPVGHAVNPVEELHRIGVITVRRMFGEGVVEARVDQEVSKVWMVYPVHQHGEIARPMIAVGLPGACRVEVQTRVHVDNSGLKGG